MGNGIACTIFGIYGENRSRPEGSGDVPGDQALVRSDVGIAPDASAGMLSVRLQHLARGRRDLASKSLLKELNQPRRPHPGTGLQLVCEFPPDAPGESALGSTGGIHQAKWRDLEIDRFP